MPTRRIVAYGLRNPFRFAIRPGTDELWVGDVGWSTTEEIDRLPAGQVRNFGWPCFEGGIRQARYDALGLGLCESLYAAGGESGPSFSYDHTDTVTAGDGCVHPEDSSAVSGLAFERGPSFPDAYDGALFFADIQRSCIWAIPDTNNDGSPVPERLSRFAGEATYPVDVQFGPGGSLYYVDLFNGALRRVRWTGPTAVAQGDAGDRDRSLAVELRRERVERPERRLRRALLRLGPRRRRRLRRLVRGDADPRVRAARQLSRPAARHRSRRAHRPRLGRGRGQPVLCRGRSATIGGTNANERLVGTPGPDVIAAEGGKDRVKGGAGRDIVCAGGGADRARGGGGRDLLAGSQGRDQLRGGGGKDRIIGGPGRDLCGGGAGDDKVSGCA